MKIEKVKVWGRGQITIPTKIRNEFGIEEDTILTLEPVEGGIFLRPAKLSLYEIQKIISDGRKKLGITVKEMLDTLDEDEE